MSKKIVYKIHSKLSDYKPGVWRGFKINANATLAELAFVLMYLYKMKGSHLFAFEIPKKNNLKVIFNKSDSYIRFELPFEDRVDSHYVKDASKSTLASLIKKEKEKFYFEYDFGNNWQINLKLEKILEEETDDLPIVISGSGYGIIEDSGGVYGLMEIDEILKLNRGNRYKETIKWYGKETIDKYLSGFDIKAINENIKKSINDFIKWYGLKIKTHT